VKLLKLGQGSSTAGSRLEFHFIEKIEFVTRRRYTSVLKQVRGSVNIPGCWDGIF
jgi:hypothetical protein